MLLKLEKYWIKKWYFIKKKIKDFDRKWWEKIPLINLEAIEFDKTWEHKDLKLWLKSADALIFKTNSELHFIEFKKNITLNKNMSSKKLRWKIQESFILLTNIYTQNTFNIHWKKKKDLFYLCKKEFIFWHDWEITSKLLFQFNLNKNWLEFLENNLKISLIDMNDIK